MKRSNVEMKLIIMLILLFYVMGQPRNIKKKEVITNTFDNDIDKKNIIEKTIFFLNVIFLSTIANFKVFFTLTSNFITNNTPVAINFINEWKTLLILIISIFISIITVFFILKCKYFGEDGHKSSFNNSEDPSEKIPLAGRKLKKPKFQVDYSNIFKNSNNSNDYNQQTKSNKNMKTILLSNNENNYNDLFSISIQNEYEKAIFEEKGNSNYKNDEILFNIDGNKNECIDFTNPKVQSYVFSNSKYEIENTKYNKHIDDKNDILNLFTDINSEKSKEINKSLFEFSKDFNKENIKTNNTKVPLININDDFLDFFSEANKNNEVNEIANKKEEINNKYENLEENNNNQLQKLNTNKVKANRSNDYSVLKTIKEANEDFHDQSSHNLTNTSTTISLVDDCANEDERILQKIKKMNLKRCMIKPNN